MTVICEDLRCEISKDTLVGWTINLIKSVLPEAILEFSNEQEFMEALKDKGILKGRGWGEFLKEVIEDETMKLKDDLSAALDDKYKQRLSEKMKDVPYEKVESWIKPYRERLKKFFSDPNNKAVCEKKADEPHEWIDVKGRVEPGEVGATRNMPGFFVPIDSGRVEFLAQKSYMHEYWFHGEVFNGKFIVRLLASRPEWKKSGGRQVWMMWRTKDDDLPYVLKKRAVDLKWMPPDGVSALPEHMRKHVPYGLEYWRYSGEKARQLRDELSSLVRKGKIKLVATTEMLEEEKVKFQLKRLWWKGPTVIRGVPQIFYVLLFHKGEEILYGWHLVHNIAELNKVFGEKLGEDIEKTDLELIAEDAQALMLSEKELDPELLKETGSLPPEHPLNPNKKLDLNFDTVDSGDAVILSEEKDVAIKFEMDGKAIKGVYVMVRQSPGSNLWRWKRSTPPKAKEYAKVPPSGKKLGGVIKPGDVSDSFKEPIKLQDNFVFIANPDRETTGDIDIFIRAPFFAVEEPESSLKEKSREELLQILERYKMIARLFDDWYNRALHFRIERAVKAKHPEFVDRLHIVNDFRGPFSDAKPVYDLVLMPSESPVIRMTRERLRDTLIESFNWARKYEVDLDRYQATGETWIRGKALFPVVSRNNRFYSKEEITKMARTAIGKPIMINHGASPYENLHIGVIEDAEEEDGVIEFLGRITDEEWAEKVRNMPKEQRKLSVGAYPREVKQVDGKEVPEGLIISEISIIVPPAKPGVPQTSYQVRDREGDWE